MACEKIQMTPLSSIVQAFEKLAENIKKDEEELSCKDFCEACALVSVLFNSLGLAFKFAEMEYCAKVRGLLEASKTHSTLHEILDEDVKNATVKCQGSLSRNLRRVRQGLDLIRALFDRFLSTEDSSLREVASTAYSQTCAPFHSWTIRTAVSAGMYALPSRDQLIQNLKETDETAEKRMKKYIEASVPIIQYIDKLYISRDINLDW